MRHEPGRHLWEGHSDGGSSEGDGPEGVEKDLLSGDNKKAGVNGAEEAEDGRRWGQDNFGDGL